MTDTDKLKRLAEDVLVNSLPVCAEYVLSEAILALIAERDEAVALLRDAKDRQGTWELTDPPVDRWKSGNMDGRISSFISRIDAKEPK